MHAGSVLRALRAGVFAAVCVLLASVGHTLMSGHSVPGWILMTVWLGTALLAWSLAARERGALLVGALTVGAQALLHCAFSLGQALAVPGGTEASLAGRWVTALLGHPGHPESRPAQDQTSAHSMHAGGGMEHHVTSSDMGAMAGHGAHHSHQTGAAMPDPAASSDGMFHDGMPGGTAGMIAAHLLVALLSAWWLWGGERAAFRAVRAASVRLFAPLVAVFDATLPAPPLWCAWDGRNVLERSRNSSSVTPSG